MYVHLGNEIVIKKRDIIGIFDLEKCSLGQATKSFFSNATKNKNVINVSYEMPKSFIVCTSEQGQKVYISHISSVTLKKRAAVFI